MGFRSRPVVARPLRREPMVRRGRVTGRWSTSPEGRTIATPGSFPVAQVGDGASLGVDVIGWREVPHDPSVLGGMALGSLPGIEQLLLRRPPGLAGADCERALYLARRRAERAFRERSIDCYIVSMSVQTVVYKGLIMAHQLEHFYHDLNDPSMVSSFAMVHSRFSTNTLGSWKLAHPYRYIIHNGEINTLRGNINWMVARQASMESPLFGDDLTKLFPIIWPGQSDTACIDNAFELMLHTGRPLHHVMMALIT